MAISDQSLELDLQQFSSPFFDLHDRIKFSEATKKKVWSRTVSWREYKDVLVPLFDVTGSDDNRK